MMVEASMIYGVNLYLLLSAPINRGGYSDRVSLLMCVLAKLAYLNFEDDAEERKQFDGHLEDLEMDLVTRKVTRGGRTLDLTEREFELLEHLLRHQGHVVSREMLARDVWREVSRATPLGNLIDVYTTRLRKKVDQDFPLKLLHTVRGVGFVLQEVEP